MSSSTYLLAGQVSEHGTGVERMLLIPLSIAHAPACSSDDDSACGGLEDRLRSIEAAAADGDAAGRDRSS